MNSLSLSLFLSLSFSELVCFLFCVCQSPASVVAYVSPVPVLYMYHWSEVGPVSAGPVSVGHVSLCLYLWGLCLGGLYLRGLYLSACDMGPDCASPPDIGKVHQWMCTVKIGKFVQVTQHHEIVQALFTNM